MKLRSLFGKSKPRIYRVNKLESFFRYLESEFNTSLETVDAMEYVERADKNIIFRPHNNGFYLNNKDLSLSYTKITANRSDILNLVLASTPKITLVSRYLPSDYFPCLDIIAENPDRNGEPRNIYVSNDGIHFRLQEWFTEGSEVFSKAFQKYDLHSYYQRYTA